MDHERKVVRKSIFFKKQTNKQKLLFTYRVDVNLYLGGIPLGTFKTLSEHIVFLFNLMSDV